MRKIYQGPRIPGIADSSVILICTGEDEVCRFSEYYVLFINLSKECKLLATRLSIQRSTNEVFSWDEFIDSTLLYATSAAQQHIDGLCKELGTLPPTFAPQPCEDSVLRSLRYAGLCQKEMKMIQATTCCKETREFLGALRALPVITPTPLSE